MTRSLLHAATLLLFGLTTGCPSSPREDLASSSSSSSRGAGPHEAPLGAASASTRGSPSARSARWYEGRWTGSYAARRHQPDVAADAGRLRAWDEDDGTQGVGRGRLEISIDAAGRAQGEAAGPLGELIASGAVEGDSVRLALVPAEGAPPAGETASVAFNGHLIVNRKDSKLVGVLRASSGDSALVRRGDVELTKAGLAK